MNVLIVEDELAGQQLLSELIKMYCQELTIIGMVRTVAEAVVAINTHQPTLVFLDIELPQESGMKLFDYFERPSFQVIFTTSHDEYAVEAFKHSAVDYLLKPLSGPELVKAVKKVRTDPAPVNQESIGRLKSRFEKIYERISVATLNGFDFYRISEIVRAEADGRYTCIYLDSGKKVLSAKNIGAFSDKLVPKGFFRAHRSHLINLAFLSRYHRGNTPLVEMEDGSILPVSGKRKEELLQILKRLF